uniref:RNase H type-1 domain-containing protein n=2 Tax=Nicotiana TaxID=4085 RepID=A0A1S3YKG4_TOBAC
MFFDGAVNAKDVGIRPILISSTGKNYPTITQLRFLCTDNTSDNEAYIMGMNMAVDQDVEELLIMGDSDLIIRQAQEDLSKQFKSVEFRYNPQFHNELADALATLASMLPYPGKQGQSKTTSQDAGAIKAKYAETKL